MKKKQFFTTSLLLLTSLSLMACGSKQATESHQEHVEPRQIIAEHSDIRLAFNKIILGKEKDEFKGGTNLATLKELFGEPKNYEEIPAGDVTLDSYHWQFDQVDITVQLFEDSAIVRSLSHFSFIREDVNGLEQFNKLEEGMTYTQVTDILGEPDVLSEAVSSDREQLQAIWSSGLKTDSNNGQIEVILENNKLVTFKQFNLVK